MNLAFADYVLNVEARQLTRGGIVAPLEPKMYALLEVLIQRRPAVVTNVELDELLWPQVYVARTSLTRLVSELRSVLGDSPRDSQIIRTVYKTGYAFAATVTSDSARRPLTAASLIWKDRPLPLIDGENIAGRGVECALVIDATTVSRRHARIIMSSGIATIEDLGSTNGTHINDVRISSPTRLKDCDDVALGNAVLKFRTSDPSALTVVDGNRNSPAAAHGPVESN